MGWIQSSQRHHTQCQRKEYVVRSVRSVQQVPRYLADYSKPEQLQEVLHSVSGMPETSAMRKANTGKAMRPKQLMTS